MSPSGIQKPSSYLTGPHYVSATESSQLMLCKIWVFHGDDYEECRLPGYRNPVRTSQGTHYVSVTKSSRLMLCKIWSFLGGDYEECRLRECDVAWIMWEPMFRMIVSPWWLRRYVFPKCLLLQEPHGVTSQKIAFSTNFGEIYRASLVLPLVPRENYMLSWRDTHLTITEEGTGWIYGPAEGFCQDDNEP
jgi:hypothetical protein